MGGALALEVLSVALYTLSDLIIMQNGFKKVEYKCRFIADLCSVWKCYERN